MAGCMGGGKGCMGVGGMPGLGGMSGLGGMGGGMPGMGGGPPNPQLAQQQLMQNLIMRDPKLAQNPQLAQQMIASALKNQMGGKGGPRPNGEAPPPDVTVATPQTQTKARGAPPSTMPAVPAVPDAPSAPENPPCAPDAAAAPDASAEAAAGEPGAEGSGKAEDNKDTPRDEGPDGRSDRRDRDEEERRRPEEARPEEVERAAPAAGGQGEAVPSGIDKSEEVKVVDPQGEPVDMKPLQRFDECPWSSALQAEISKAGFVKPSQIQAYSWPIALKGNDVVGIAATGSGKTIAFLFPAFDHILSNRIGSRDPTLLVLAPTRELAVQIEKEAQRFGNSSRILTVCAYGGAPKFEQLKQMRNGCHCLIATPGRLNDFIEGKQVRLDQVCKMVLDEADRMLDMGFEPQIRKILKEVPRKRHTLFFTATWPKEVRKLAEDFLYKPYQVQIGDRNELKANADITQIVKILAGHEKNPALLSTLQEYKIGGNPEHRCLVFCATKRQCDQLERDFQRNNFRIAAIHGDKDQRQRDEALDKFREGRVTILVATDVAARGLDIKGVVLVINFDPANNAEDYVHRIGRTGRAGQKGTAVTFLTADQSFKAQGIVEIMDKTSQPVSEELRKLAASAPPKGKGKSRFREGGDGDRPGFDDEGGDERGGRRGRRGKGERDDADGGAGGGRGSFNGGGSFGGGGAPKSNPFARNENRKSGSPSPPARRRSRSRQDRSRSRRERRRSPSRRPQRRRSRSRSGGGRRGGGGDRRGDRDDRDDDRRGGDRRDRRGDDRKGDRRRRRSSSRRCSRSRSRSR